MDVLPLHLQARIYGEAAVSGVCTASREEVLRCALLADQRDLDAPFEEGEDGPAPQPTWRIADMAGRLPGETEPQLAAALRCTAQRFAQLQHVSVSVGREGHSRRGPRPRPITSGLLRFIQHVVPALASSTRLTIRGRRPALPRGCEALPWQLLSRTPLGAACTRLDLSADEESVHSLLTQLAGAFPVVQDVRVRSYPSSIRRADGGHMRVTRLVAPDSLTRLTLLLWPVCKAHAFRPELARGLQELVCHTLPPSKPNLGRLVVVEPGDAPALHTVRSRMHLYVLTSGSRPALRHIETSLPDGVEDLQKYLGRLLRCAPGLVSLTLLLQEHEQEKCTGLPGWAATIPGLTLNFAAL